MVRLRGRLSAVLLLLAATHQVASSKRGGEVQPGAAQSASDTLGVGNMIMLENDTKPDKGNHHTGGDMTTLTPHAVDNAKGAGLVQTQENTTYPKHVKWNSPEWNCCCTKTKQRKCKSKTRVATWIQIGRLCCKGRGRPCNLAVYKEEQMPDFSKVQNCPNWEKEAAPQGPYHRENHYVQEKNALKTSGGRPGRRYEDNVWVPDDNDYGDHIDNDGGYDGGYDGGDGGDGGE